MGARLLGLGCLGLVVLLVSFLGVLGGWTGWPWEPLRFTLAFAGLAFVLSGPQRWAVATVAVWAVIASPVTIGPRGYTSYGGTTVGSVGPYSSSEGPFAIYAGPIPAGTTWLTTPKKGSIGGGESGDPTADLVTWSISWLPWPHVDRVKVGALSGTGDWQIPVEVLRDGHRLALASERFLGPGRQQEARAVGLGLSSSWVTWLGWVILIGCLASRLHTARRTPAATPPLL